ncbi:MAG: hypothetical protein ACRDP6_35580 [Actinoallomurus sp.]
MGIAGLGRETGETAERLPVAGRRLLGEVGGLATVDPGLERAEPVRESPEGPAIRTEAKIDLLAFHLVHETLPTLKIGYLRA